MHTRVGFLCAVFTGCTALAWAAPQQAPSSAPTSSDTAVSVVSDSSKQFSEGTPTAPETDNKTKDAKPQRKIHFQLGTVSLGMGYSHFSAPFYYSYSLFGFYPYFAAYPGYFCEPLCCGYPALLSSVYAGSLAYGQDKGEVRLTTDPKTAEVFIDGAYAGRADRLKTMWLDSGAYDLSVSAKGRIPFHERIYILSRKSLKISAKLAPEKEPDSAGARN